MAQSARQILQRAAEMDARRVEQINAQKGRINRFMEFIEERKLLDDFIDWDQAKTAERGSNVG